MFVRTQPDSTPAHAAASRQPACRLRNRLDTFRVAAALLLLLHGAAGRAVTVTAGPDLTLDPNGLTPLAALLELATDQPARVTLAISGAGTSRTLEFADYRTGFALPVLGLKPGTDYALTVTLTDTAGRKQVLEPTLQVSTAPLPADFPRLRLVTSTPALMEPGYTMTGRFIRIGGDRDVTLVPGATVLNETLSHWLCWAAGDLLGWGTCSTTAYTVIVDAGGEVVWYSTLGEINNYQLGNGSLLYRKGEDVVNVDMLGNEIRRVTLQDPGTELTHDMYPTPDGHFLSITIEQATLQNFPTSDSDPQAPRATAAVEDNPIVEFDGDGKLLHHWPLAAMLDTTRIGYHSLTKRALGYDWVHGNSVIEDSRDDSVIISLRHQDALVKFSRATGALQWILGPHANWSSAFLPYLLTPVGEPFEWQYHQHAPMVTSAGTILVFDNGNNRASPFDGNPKVPDRKNYSRAVEFAVDEQRMEVRQVWEYGQHIAAPMYAGHIGDANQLPQTGNVLITFGGTSFTGGIPNAEQGLGEVSTRIVEVTHTTPAQPVFELLVYEPAPHARLQIYRSERIPDLYPVDTDADGIPDFRDNCPLVANGPLPPGDYVSSQRDTDADGTGDACDSVPADPAMPAPAGRAGTAASGGR
ncbi:MAG: aryl-sulfate sulfotransferase [Pseudomonadota bacterium]